VIRVHTATDIGPKRVNNEDSLACLDDDIFVMADGMGGHAAGEIASRMLVDTVREVVQGDDFASELKLKRAILATNKKIIQASSRDENLKGMGTTASVCQCAGSELLWAHVGDSRIYLLHEGRIRQITRDHSLVYDLVEEGTLTAEEARNHPQRNLLTRAVGADEALVVDTGKEPLAAGDKILLCTDGLSAVVQENEIQGVLLTAQEDKASKLVELALAQGSTDNISVIVAEL